MFPFFPERSNKIESDKLARYYCRRVCLRLEVQALLSILIYMQLLLLKIRSENFYKCSVWEKAVLFAEDADSVVCHVSELQEEIPKDDRFCQNSLGQSSPPLQVRIIAQGLKKCKTAILNLELQKILIKIEKPYPPSKSPCALENFYFCKLKLWYQTRLHSWLCLDNCSMY